MIDEQMTRYYILGLALFLGLVFAVCGYDIFRGEK